MAFPCVRAEKLVPRGPCVLVVDDDADDVFFIERAFQKCGIPMQIIVAQDGRHACELLSAQRFGAEAETGSVPAMMLLDLQMPNMNGMQVLAWLRTMPEFKGMPVIVFTDAIEAEAEESARELGAVDYVRKPSNPYIFARLVHDVRARWLGQV